MITIRGKGVFAGVCIDPPYFCRRDFIAADNHAERSLSRMFSPVF